MTAVKFKEYSLWCVYVVSAYALKKQSHYLEKRFRNNVDLKNTNEKGVTDRFKFDGVIDMKIREVNENKKQFIALLLLADEQENMIDHYLEKSTMYVLEDGNVKAECVVTDEGNGILEIKNIAVDPKNQGKGYGKALIDFLASKYADEYSVLQVGTGDSPLTIPFYEKCGFVRSHKIPNFFTDNYDHPIYEGGVQLIDMIYLQRCL